MLTHLIKQVKNLHLNSLNFELIIVLDQLLTVIILMFFINLNNFHSDSSEQIAIKLMGSSLSLSFAYGKAKENLKLRYQIFYDIFF